MIGYMTIQEAAASIGKKTSWLRECAREGRIEGAVQLNGTKGMWLFPDGFQIQHKNTLPEGYITLPEVAEELGCSRQWAHSLCVRGYLQGATMFGALWGVPSPVVKLEGASARPSKDQQGDDSAPPPLDTHRHA